jgi:hypothetical protein
VLWNGDTEGQGLAQASHTGNRLAMKFKVGTTAYQRKTKTQRDVVVTIVIDEAALASVLGGRAINNRSKETKVLRGIIRGGVHVQ